MIKIKTTFFLCILFSILYVNAQTYHPLTNLQVLKGTGTAPNYNFAAGDVLVQRNAINLSGVNYDAVIKILSRNLGGVGTLEAYNGTFRFRNIDGQKDPTVQYNLTLTQAGSATPTNLNGIPVVIENLTLYLPDIDGTNDIYTNQVKPAQMYVDAAGYRLPASYIGSAPAITTGSALAVRSPALYNSTKASDYTIYRANVSQRDETDNLLSSGTFLNNNAFVLKLEFSTFPEEGIDLVFSTTTDPSQVNVTQVTGNRQIFNVLGVFDQTGVLPVGFGDFTAFIQNGKLLLNWNTISEINNDKFIIEVSKTGIDGWKKVAEVKSKAVNGNSVENIDYATELNVANALGLLAATMLFGLFIPGISRRKRIVLSILALSMTVGYFSCQKSDLVQNVNTGEKYLYV